MKDCKRNDDYEPKQSPGYKLLTGWISLGLSILSLVAIIFGVYFFLSKPGQDNDVAIQLLNERVLAQRTTIDALTLTQQNDIKEVKNEVSGLRSEIQVLTNNITELKTIIQERIPAKK